MFKLALWSLVFGGYALASGGGGDDTPPVYYQYAYECKSTRTDLKVTMSAIGSGYYVSFTNLQVSGPKYQMNAKINLETNSRYATEKRYTQASQGLPEIISSGNFTLSDISKAKTVSGSFQHRDSNHHIELFSDKSGTYTNSLEAFIYDLHSGSPIYNEKLKCTLKIESYEGK